MPCATQQVVHITRGAGWLLALIMMLAAALRLPNLGGESYWLDELAALKVAHHAWHELGHVLTTTDVHPPLYFIVLKLWGSAFGFGEVATRALSVLLSLIAVALTYGLGRYVGGVRAGLLAAAFVACSPLCVYYAREARAYSLLLCLSLASTLLLLRASPHFRPRHLIAYVLSASLLLYTHVYGAFTVLAHALYALTFWGHRMPRRRAAWRCATAGVAIALIYLPWLPSTFAQSSRVMDDFWIPPPMPFTWWQSWQHRGPLALAWVGGTVALASVALLQLWQRRRRAVVLLGAGMGTPAMLPIAISLALTPIYSGKYAIAAAAIVLVAAALGVAHTRSWLAWSAAALVCLFGLGETLRHVHGTRHKEDWRTLGAFASQVGQHTPLAMNRVVAPFMRHYLEHDVEVQPLVLDQTLLQQLEAAETQRFWLLNVHPGRLDPEVEEVLQRRFVPRAHCTWFRAEAWLWIARDVAGVGALPTASLIGGHSACVNIHSANPRDQ